MHTSTLESQPERMSNRVEIDKLIIVADDLTGACDSGVAFLASGCDVRVVLDSEPAPAQRKYPEAVLSFNTETRHKSRDQAAERVAATMQPFVGETGNRLFFKKVDSAARGHFGAEVMAAQQSSGALLALVAPAFPHAGRTVHAGLLDIRDTAGQHTTISLRDLFPEVNDVHIAVVTVDAEGALAEAIQRALADGIRVLLCDAQSQEDLERLATAALQLRHSILWAGSAGLARALACVLPTSREPRLKPVSQRRGRTLLFYGTDHPVTKIQIDHLEAHPTAASLRAIHRVDSQSRQKIRETFNEAPVYALILTGGDTAAFVLRALDASSIVLGGEISAGIPWGVVGGGLADNCIVITKSGGFGQQDALALAFEFCDGRAL